MIKILYVLLVLCTAALVAVGIGLVLRVRRHLKPGPVNGEGVSDREEAPEHKPEDNSS